MFNLSFTACSFYFQKLNSRNVKNIYILNQLIEYRNKDTRKLETIQVKDLLVNFFKEYETSINDKSNQKTFRCEFDNSFSGDTNEFYYTYTIIKSGIYGSASDIIDIDTRKLVHEKTANQADERAFYLYIVIPKGSSDTKVQKGLLFFQNVGQFGVKTICTDFMKKFFSSKYSLAFKCRTVSAELFIRKIITKENVNKLIMIRNHLSDDNSDNMRLGYGQETRTIGKLFNMNNAWDKLINEIRAFTKGRHNLFEFEEAEFDTLKVNVKIGGAERTIDLHNLENLSIVEGIPNEIKMPDGLPDKTKLLAHFEKVANEYLSDMVLEIK